MDSNTSALGGQRIRDETAEFSRRRRAQISLGVAPLAKPDKIYSVGNCPRARAGEEPLGLAEQRMRLKPKRWLPRPAMRLKPIEKGSDKSWIGVIAHVATTQNHSVKTASPDAIAAMQQFSEALLCPTLVQDFPFWKFL
jgi:hypothetical protein